MYKIIAKTTEGKEFFYSRKDCFSVSKASCQKICNALNQAKYQLKDNEKWFVYDISDFDIKYTNACFQKLNTRKGKIYITEYWSVYPGYKS